MKTILAKLLCLFLGHTWAHLRRRRKNGFTTHFYYCQRCKARQRVVYKDQPTQKRSLP